MPVFSSVQLLLNCVGGAKANFYIGLLEQISYPSDQWAVVCKGYLFTALCCYFFFLLCLGLFLFFSLLSTTFLQPHPDFIPAIFLVRVPRIRVILDSIDYQLSCLTLL